MAQNLLYSWSYLGNSSDMDNIIEWVNVLQQCGALVENDEFLDRCRDIITLEVGSMIGANLEIIKEVADALVKRQEISITGLETLVKEKPETPSIKLLILTRDVAEEALLLKEKEEQACLNVCLNALNSKNVEKESTIQYTGRIR